MSLPLPPYKWPPSKSSHSSLPHRWAPSPGKIEQDRRRISAAPLHRTRLLRSPLPRYDHTLPAGHTSMLNSYQLYRKWVAHSDAHNLQYRYEPHDGASASWRKVEHRDIVNYFDDLGSRYNPECWALDPSEYTHDADVQRLYARRVALENFHPSIFPLPDVIVPAIPENLPKNASSLYKKWKAPQLSNTDTMERRRILAKYYRENEHYEIIKYFKSLHRVTSEIHRRRFPNSKNRDKECLCDIQGEDPCMIHLEFYMLQTAVHPDYDVGSILSYSPVEWNAIEQVG